MFAPIKDAIDAISNGKMVIVLDDEDRENEGDLVIASQFATPDAINFMIKHARGLICVSLLEDQVKQLHLEPMKSKHKVDAHHTAFLSSIDATEAFGVTTGISASDRSTTIQLAIKKGAKSEDFISPGHIFPLLAKKMGVLKRAGHTEASVDLARLANLTPSGVICEIIKENGEMARRDDLIEFAKKHNLLMITIKDLIQYRIQEESFIEEGETVKMPTESGDFILTSFSDLINQKTHFALIKGSIDPLKPTLVRVHSECLTGDVFLSKRCDCGSQLTASLKSIEEEGCGVLLYMSQEGRGIGIENKLKAYKLQEEGYNTIEANEKLGFPADLREYGVGAQILRHLGIKEMRLMTNNPTKIVGLEGFNLKVVERVPIVIKSNPHNHDYLKTKKDNMGHIFND